MNPLEITIDPYFYLLEEEDSVTFDYLTEEGASS